MEVWIQVVLLVAQMLQSPDPPPECAGWGKPLGCVALPEAQDSKSTKSSRLLCSLPSVVLGSGGNRVNAHNGRNGCIPILPW